MQILFGYRSQTSIIVPRLQDRSLELHHSFPLPLCTFPDLFVARTPRPSPEKFATHTGSLMHHVLTPSPTFVTYSQLTVLASLKSGNKATVATHCGKAEAGKPGDEARKPVCMWYNVQQERMRGRAWRWVLIYTLSPYAVLAHALQITHQYHTIVHIILGCSERSPHFLSSSWCWHQNNITK